MTTMSETITLNIDDVEVTVAASTTILEAAATAGIEVIGLCGRDRATSSHTFETRSKRSVSPSKGAS